MSSVLSVQSVTKTFGAVKALDGVTLGVGAGEFVALLGPNGAGKTTPVQLLTGLFVADSGSILVAGQDMARNAVPALAQLGVVFQQPTLDAELSVAGNLRFHAMLHGMDGATARARIERELVRFDLSESRKKPVRTLSGGNRRRVELARALMHDPSALLMDEATVGLDPASRKLLLDHVLAQTKERGLGVLWATHLIDEADHADRVVVLHRGAVLFDGTPRAMRESQGVGPLADAFLKLTSAGAAVSEG